MIEEHGLGNFFGISYVLILHRMTSDITRKNFVKVDRSGSVIRCGLETFRIHGVSVKPFTVASHEKRRLRFFFRTDRVLAYRSLEDRT